MISDDDWDKLNLIIREDGCGAFVWGAEKVFAQVSIIDLIGLMWETQFSNIVINGCMEMISINQAKVASDLKGIGHDFPNRSYFINSYCWFWITQGDKKILADNLNPKIIEAFFDNYRFVHFPINTLGLTSSTGHWTLLVCDKQEKKWTHNNLINLRRPGDVDRFYENAKRLVRYVNALLSKEASEYQLLDAEISNSNNVPDPGSSVVDCGVAIIHIMKSIFNSVQINVNYGIEGFRRERAALVHEFLNDPPRSWTFDDFQTRKNNETRRAEEA